MSLEAESDYSDFSDQCAVIEYVLSNRSRTERDRSWGPGRGGSMMSQPRYVVLLA